MDQTETLFVEPPWGVPANTPDRFGKLNAVNRDLHRAFGVRGR